MASQRPRGAAAEASQPPASSVERPSSRALEVLSPEGHQVRFSSAAGHPISSSAAPPPKTASPLSTAVPLISLPRKAHDCCGRHSNESSKIGLLPDSSTEGLNSSLEQLTLEGQSCVVCLPEGDKLSKGKSSTGDVEDRSSHSDEGSSDEESEEREPCTQEDILKDAGVEIVLEELSCTEDGKAPLELVTQFLACAMDEQYEAARILCEHILRFEPSNPTAREFYPVLVEKIRIESMLESESESDEEDTEDSESSDDSSSDEGTAEDDHSPAEVDGGCCNGIHESPHQPPS